jgi:hypothetical protein
MFRRFVVSSLIGSGLFLGAAFAADPDFKFTSINNSGAIATIPQGINASGDIVGRYKDPFNVSHGFLWPHNGQLVSFDVPDDVAGGHVAYTDARGINPGGDIVGYYVLAGDEGVAGRGFLRRRDGTFLRVYPPAPHLNVYLQRIQPDGSIQGCYHDHDTGMSMYGAVLSRGVWTAFPLPMSMTNGATPDLSVETGFAVDMMVTPPRSRAFLRRNGDPNPVLFDYNYNRSGNVSATSAWDMNPLGAIVGNYRIGTDPPHGFLLKNGTFSSIEYQAAGLVGPTVTSALGINVHGDIVGWYTDPTTNFNQRGFLATPNKPAAK